MNIAPIAEAISSWARAKPLVRRVWIFGSRVRDDFRPESDLDIAIELDPTVYCGFDESGGLATWMFETTGWRDELQSLSPYTIQLEQYQSDQTPTITEGIIRSSRLIYEKYAPR